MQLTRFKGLGLGLPAAAVIACACAVLPGCIRHAPGVGFDAAAPTTVDAGPGSDAAAPPDAASALDADGCEEVPARSFFGCQGLVDQNTAPFLYEYEPLDGCEGQPYCFQDERCLGWMLGQLCPEIAASDIADLDSETVVVIEYDGRCMHEICSASRCPGELTLSIQPEWCGNTDWVRSAATMIVIPKTDREELMFMCYDGLRGRCDWGEPTSTNPHFCF